MKTITIRVHLSDEELVRLAQLAAWFNEWQAEHIPDTRPLTAEEWLSASLNGMIRREYNEEQRLHSREAEHAA